MIPCRTADQVARHVSFTKAKTLKTSLQLGFPVWTSHAAACAAARQVRNVAEFGTKNFAAERFRQPTPACKDRRDELLKQARQVALQKQARQVATTRHGKLVGHIARLDAALKNKTGHLLLRPTSIEGEVPVMHPSDITPTQTFRLHEIIRGLRDYMVLLNEKTTRLLDSDTSTCAELRQLHDTTILRNVTTSLPFSHHRFRKHYADFTAGVGHLSTDKRGNHFRNWLLTNPDLLFKFKNYMRSEKFLTVDKTTKFVNGPLFMGDPKEAEVLEKFGLAVPISRDVVYRYCDAMF